MIANSKTTTVTNVWSGPQDEVLQIDFGDSTLKVTKDHPVYLPNQEFFVWASSLKLGDELLDTTGESARHFKNSSAAI
jgi:hypothetical protein